MATATAEITLGLDDWQQIPASWGTYLRLLRDRGERAIPRYTYFQGKLTIMSPGPSHEWIKKRLAGLIEEILVGLMIAFRPLGAVTLLEGDDTRAGIEGDECYYLTRLDLVRGKKKIVMGQDPPPDLSVEVVATHPLGDTLEVYAAFRVGEVWVCERSEVVFMVLGPDGTYSPSAVSRCLPFLSAEELTPWVYRDDADEAQIRHEFRAWVAATLAPRRQGPPAP